MSAWLCIFVCVSVGRFVTAGLVRTGQPREVSPNSTEVLSAARFAVAEFNRASAEDEFAYKLVNITSAKIQVVAGVNYILEVQLARTVCKRRNTTDGETCGYQFEPKELKCHFIVTEVPWENSCVLTQKKCHLHN